jgi:hypothetical protein
MFNGIAIAYPFLIPPLRPSYVVNEIVQSLDISPTNTFLDFFHRHKVIWAPVTYYVLPFLNIIFPVW